MVSNLSNWITLIIVILIIVFIIKIGAKLINVIITGLILFFCWFSFFTEVGAARLSILLTGHPIVAYTTSLERMDEMSEGEVSYFKSSKDVIVAGKKIEYVKCNKMWIVRIPNVEGTY